MRNKRIHMKLDRLFGRLRDHPVETDLQPYRKILGKFRAHFFQNISSEELRARSARLISKARSGVPRDELLAEAFALVDEASRRAIDLAPYDCQVLAGLVMAEGKIAELPTGEGKTLAAVFPVYLHALSGRGVHVLTFNDYLARRDASWMGPVYELLGITVGCIQEGMPAPAKRAAYLCDVTYATAKEAGFDFLRDQVSTEREETVHRPFHLALVDEADSILIDEARIPLVISGVEEREGWDPHRLAAAVKALIPGRDYETDDEHRNVFLLDPGQERIEALLRSGGLYNKENQALLEAVYCALHAEALLRRDVDYIVRRDKIEIVDEFTGRVVDNRHWPDGLQAAVEAKEGLVRRSRGRILGSITLQHFFRLYPKLCGMTATARPSAEELKEFYGLRVAVIPPNRPRVRTDHPDRVFTHREAKRAALVEEIRQVRAAGRPILVGTASVKESEELAADLRKAGVPCHVLNAKNDELEAGIIAQAGRPGAVTISTNMAGRGTDIKLGGADEEEREKALALGGLYVIGTNRHESRRIDDQLRGRAGRQGDPGASRFFISLEDDLFERYGLTRMFYEHHRLECRQEALDSKKIQREIDHAQRIVEGQNFDIRKSLSKYSSFVEVQRKMVQNWRESVFSAEGGVQVIAQKNPRLTKRGLARFGRAALEAFERRALLFHIDRLWSDHLAWITDTRESIHLVSLGGKTPLQEFQKAVTAAFLEIRPRVEEAVAADFKNLLKKEGDVNLEVEGRKGPASTWTYLVNEDQFGFGIEMLQGKNIGFAAAAALYVGPLYVITLIMNKLFKRKKGGGTSRSPGR
ncbi:MAG: accessory Sec system translocase SecA2 [Candidatus Aminicenantes bacterium]|nr:accessory Sec system translocase SecA2 [Candidatus Aminicenantes bacterium]